ncbi:hypothetical protein AB0892_23515 [Streptomyces sp. NPDC005409]|uniref:hypothetical protein n=1 Tax=Streptomyces sp. NPDC005409 TaxID=3155342 RepID=UPI003452E37C
MVLLAAARPDIAQALLREALASCPQEAFVPSITAVNEWAMDGGLAAGVDIVHQGSVAVRDMPVPEP